MEFINREPIKAIEEYVLKSRHSRNENQDDVYLAFESKVEDVMGVFLSILLGPREPETLMEDLGGFLRCIRDSPIALKRFITSAKFPSVLTQITEHNSELLVNFLELLDAVPPSCDLFHEDVAKVLADRVSSLVTHEDLAVAESSSKLLEKICVMYPHSGLPALLSGAGKVQGDGTMTLRFASIVGQLLNSRWTESPVDTNEKLFLACVEYNVVDLLLSLSVNCDDLLVQILGVELLSQFAGSAASVKYFFEKNHFQWVLSEATSVLKADPNSASFVAATCLNEVAQFILKGIQGYTADTLRHYLTRNHVDELICCCEFHFDAENHSDETARAASLSVCTALASLSPHWLHIIIANKALMECWIGLIVGGPDTQAAVLTSVATVLHYYERENTVGTSSSATEAQLLERDLFRLVELIGVYLVGNLSTVTYLVRTACQPVRGLAIAAMKLMEALAAQRSGWGMALLFECSRFLPFLRDHSTSTCKEQMDAKYAVLVALSRSVRYIELSDETRTALEKQIELGPYAPPRSAELADPLTM